MVEEQLLEDIKSELTNLFSIENQVPRAIVNLKAKQIGAKSLEEIVKVTGKTDRDIDEIWGLPEPISIFAFGSYLTEDVSLNSDIDCHVVYNPDIIKNEGRFIELTLKHVAQKLRQWSGVEINFWVNSPETYVENRALDVPQTDLFKLDGWGSVGWEYLLFQIAQTGTTIYGEDIPSTLKKEKQLPKSVGYEVLMLSIMDLAKGIIYQDSAKIGKSVLRSELGQQIITTGEGEAIYRLIDEKSGGDIVHKAYLAKVVSQKGFWHALKYWYSQKFKLKEMPWINLTRQKHQRTIIDHFFRLKKEQKKDYRLTVQEQDHRERTSLAIVEGLSELEKVPPELFMIYCDEFLAYKHGTELEDSKKVFIIPRKKKTVDKINDIIQDYFTNESRLIGKPNLESEVMLTRMKLYSNNEFPKAPEGTNPIMHVSKESGKAYHFFKELLEDDSVNNETVRYYWAAYLLKNFRFEEAKAIIEEEKEKNPDNIKFMRLRRKLPFMLGNLNPKKGYLNVSQRSFSFDRILAADPTNIEALVELDRIKRFEDNEPEQLDPSLFTFKRYFKGYRNLLLEEAIKANPNNPYVYLFIAEKRYKNSVTGNEPELYQLEDIINAVKKGIQKSSPYLASDNITYDINDSRDLVINLCDVFIRSCDSYLENRYLIKEINDITISSENEEQKRLEKLFDLYLVRQNMLELSVTFIQMIEKGLINRAAKRIYQNPLPKTSYFSKPSRRTFDVIEMLASLYEIGSFTALSMVDQSKTVQLSGKRPLRREDYLKMASQFNSHAVRLWKESGDKLKEFRAKWFVLQLFQELNNPNALVAYAEHLTQELNSIPNLKPNTKGFLFDQLTFLRCNLYNQAGDQEKFRKAAKYFADKDPKVVEYGFDSTYRVQEMARTPFTQQFKFEPVDLTEIINSMYLT